MPRMSAAQIKSQVGDDPNGVLNRPEGDFYRTGAIAVDKLLAVESFEDPIWEPACGDGAISKILEANEHAVISSDLYDRGYGYTGVNFLTTDPGEVANFKPRSIITNPPYTLAEDFALRALEVLPPGAKVALLARLLWLEGSNRHHRLFSLTPPARVWVFSSRIPMARGNLPFRIGMVAFAWFVWEIGNYGQTQLGWI